MTRRRTRKLLIVTAALAVAVLLGIWLLRSPRLPAVWSVVINEQAATFAADGKTFLTVRQSNQLADRPRLSRRSLVDGRVVVSGSPGSERLPDGRQATFVSAIDVADRSVHVLGFDAGGSQRESLLLSGSEVGEPLTVSSELGSGSFYRWFVRRPAGEFLMSSMEDASSREVTGTILHWTGDRWEPRWTQRDRLPVDVSGDGRQVLASEYAKPNATAARPVFGGTRLVDLESGEEQVLPDADGQPVTGDITPVQFVGGDRVLFTAEQSVTPPFVGQLVFYDVRARTWTQPYVLASSSRSQVGLGQVRISPDGWIAVLVYSINSLGPVSLNQLHLHLLHVDLARSDRRLDVKWHRHIRLGRLVRMGGWRKALGAERATTSELSGDHQLLVTTESGGRFKTHRFDLPALKAADE